MTTLTAPIRRIGHAARVLAGLGLAVPRTVAGPVVRMRRRPPWPWPDAEGGEGVREPRRPRPKPPAGAIAMREPAGEGESHTPVR
jgi:hypothetical protein